MPSGSNFFANRMKTIRDFTRRDFLKLAGSAAAATCVAQPTLALAAEHHRLLATCRDIYLGLTGEPDCWSALKSLGAQGAEVLVNEKLDCPMLKHPDHHYTLATAAGRDALKEGLAQSGMRISAFLLATRFDDRLERSLKWVRGAVAAADQLGVRAIRIDVAPVHHTPAEFLPIAIQACKKVCAIGEGTAVRFGVENHGRCTNDPVFLEKLLDGVGSERLGVTLDVANFYWWGHPLDELYSLYKEFAPRVVHTHCKSIRYPADKRNVRRPMGWEYGKYNCPIYEGDIDFKRVVRILHEAGYWNDLCVEDESLGKFPAAERPKVLSKEIALLKRLA